MLSMMHFKNRIIEHFRTVFEKVQLISRVTLIPSDIKSGHTPDEIFRKLASGTFSYEVLMVFLSRQHILNF